MTAAGDRVEVDDSTRTVTVVASADLRTAFMHLLRVTEIPVEAEAAALCDGQCGPGWGFVVEPVQGIEQQFEPELGVRFAESTDMGDGVALGSFKGRGRLVMERSDD